MTLTETAVDNVVQVTDLVKMYDELRAVDGISFSVKRGETFGLLGPNGAGKTTTMRMMAGLSPATSGSIYVAGLDVNRSGRDVRNEIGVVTQHDGLDNSLVVHRNLELHGYLAGLSYRDAIERTKEVLGFFNLEGRANASIHALSGGMKRRLAIARAMMSSPQLLVMDEPTTGSGPAESESGLGAARGAEGGRGDDHHVDALHDRGGDALRPFGDYGPREHPRHRGA